MSLLEQIAEMRKRSMEQVSKAGIARNPVVISPHFLVFYDKNGGVRH